MYSNKENINILTALLVKHGVEHVVVCPGSRNAPLVHNFSECPGITCHPVTDERSAGFIALGLTQQLGRPVAVCVTSGSALLNVLPAAAEATYQHQGIIVISADRPQAWIDQLDGQTLPQQDALGKFVAKSVTLPEDDHWYCNRLVNEAMIAYSRPAHPSVHINVPITEPLFEFTTPELPDERIICRFPWSDNRLKESLVRRLTEAKKPMFVIGQTRKFDLSEDHLATLNKQFVILTEPITGGELSPSYTDQMLFAIEKHPTAYRPDLVIYLGGHTVSKRLRQFLRSLDKSVMQIMVSEDGSLHDVSMNTSMVIEGGIYEVVNDIAGCLNNTAQPSAFYNKWNNLRKEIAEKHNSFTPAYSQMLAVKLFEESQPDGSVYYANSMPVRLAALYAKHYCGCNRGLNGIEGSLSVAAGASLVSKGNVYCITGDLSFFYDENALWQQELKGNFRILLLNNSQGGIFHNLNGLEKSPVRDSYISAHHTASAEGICKQFGVKYLKATDEKSLKQGIKNLLTAKSNKPVLLEMLTDVNTDEEQYKEYYNYLCR